VVERDRAAQVLGRERIQELARLVADAAAGPGGRDRGVVGEDRDVQSAEHDEVVVADQADVAAVAGQRHALVGVGAVADEIAEAPDRVHSHPVDVGDHGLERGQVRVRVRDEGDPPGRLGMPF
jgi:hypothetical protein